MAKVKILPKLKKFSKNTRNKKLKRSTLTKKNKRVKAMKLKSNAKLKNYSPTKELCDDKFIAQALWECLKDNDSDSFLEILESHFRALELQQKSKDTEQIRLTSYHMIRGKNPTLKTLGRIISSISPIESSQQKEPHHCCV